MNATQRVLQQITTGDHVSLEIDGELLEGTVLARGRYNMTVAQDELRGQEVVQGQTFDIRFEVVTYVTVRKIAR